MEHTWFEDLDFDPFFSNETEMDGVGRDENASQTSTSSFIADYLPSLQHDVATTDTYAQTMLSPEGNNLEPILQSTPIFSHDHSIYHGSLAPELGTNTKRSILQHYPPNLPFNDTHAPWLTGRPTSDIIHPFINDDIINTYQYQPITFATDHIVTPVATFPPPMHHFASTHHFTPIQPHLIAIGTIFSTSDPDAFVFKCSHDACYPKSFGRWYDLRRHYEGKHAAETPQFWCIVQGCERSEMSGGRSFPRKDKLGEHLRKVHAGFVPV